MADRPLQQTLACERYSDGATVNVSYSEERSSPAIVEQHAAEGSGAVRTFYTAWNDRFIFIENLLGFAKTATWSGSWPDATGWNGMYIHRSLPKLGYSMGQFDSGGEPVEWVYPVRVMVTTDGQVFNGTSPLSVYYPSATYAKITVTYGSLEYDLATDASIKYTGGSAGANVNGMLEWKRYTRIIQKPASIFFQYPQQCLQSVDYPSTGQSAPLPQPVNVLDNIADFWVYVNELPYDPIVGVNQCFGKVNRYAAFPTTDYPAGQPAETLHLVAADIVRLPLKCGRRYWNLQLGFRKVFNRAISGGGSGGGPVTESVVGHNYIRRSAPDGSFKSLRFYRVSVDGTSSLTLGNPMLDVEDFTKLFWFS